MPHANTSEATTSEDIHWRQEIDPPTKVRPTAAHFRNDAEDRHGLHPDAQSTVWVSFNASPSASSRDELLQIERHAEVEDDARHQLEGH